MPGTEKNDNPLQMLVSNFMSVAGVARIIFLEFCAIFCLSGLLANLAQDLAGQGSPFDGGTVVFYLVVLVIGLACAAGLIGEMLHPVAGTTSFRGLLRLGNIQVINPADSSVPYYFCSTHPSYIFADVVLLLTVFLIFAVRLYGWQAFDGMRLFDWVSSISGTVMALGIPLFRLFSWYGLGRRLPAALIRGAWVPVLLFYLVAAVPVTAGLWLARADVLALLR